MAKSQLLAPGAYVWLNGATAHRTSSAEKPIAPATAYATALSKPLPVAGSFNFHCDPLAAPPWKYGGYAGLSVPTMSAPGLTYVVTPFAQSAAVPAIEGLPVDRTGFSEAHAAESNPRTANPTRTFRTVDPLISSVPT